MPNNFIKQRHAAYHTSEHVVFEIVKAATGQKGISREQIVRGYDNEVYAVKTEQSDDFIVRIQQHGETTFAAEAWAIQRCREAGAPAPEVYVVTTRLIEGQEKVVMIQRKVPGRALSDIWPVLSRSDLEKVFGQAGEVLGKIHTIQVGGFYKRQPDGRWDFAAWEAVIQSALRDRASEKALIIQAGFTEAEVETMLAMLEIYGRNFGCEQPVLCHGDFQPEHLFVGEDLRLTGIIDFGEFQGGPPVHDFANLSMDHPEIDLTWLQAGYAPQQLFDESFSTRLLLHKVGLQMGYLAHYVEQRNWEEVGPMARGLKATLRKWQKLS